MNRITLLFSQFIWVASSVWAAETSGITSVPFSSLKRVSLFNVTEIEHLFRTQHQRTPLNNIRAIQKHHIASNPLLTESVKACMMRLRNALVSNRPIDKTVCFKDLTLCMHPFNGYFVYNSQVYKYNPTRAAIQFHVYFIRNVVNKLLERDSSFLDQTIKLEGILHKIMNYTFKGETHYFAAPLPKQYPFTSYLMQRHITKDGTLHPIHLFYDKTSVVESGFFIDLSENLRCFKIYDHQEKQTSPTAFVFDDWKITQDVNLMEVPETYKSLLSFCFTQFTLKFGDLSKFGMERLNGETLFIPFPITEEEQTETIFVQDLLEAEELLLLLKDDTSLEEASTTAAHPKATPTKEHHLAKIQAKLEALNRRYETTNETLIATIEGKLLSLHEANYQNTIALEQAKIRAEFTSRSKPGILKKAGLSKAFIRAHRTYMKDKAEKIILDETDDIRAEFLRKIKGNYQDRKAVIAAFQQSLADRGINFHESWRGSHRTTHVEGARSVTVVTEHRGTRPMHTNTITAMLQALDAAAKKKQSHIEEIEE